MKTRSCWKLLLVIMLSSWIAFAETAPQSTSNYKDAAAQCETAIAERSKKIGDTYSTEVYRLKGQFQKEGDLEKAVVADKEWSRFLNQKSLGAGDIVEQPAELQQLQQKYAGMFAQVSQTVAQEQIEALNDIKKQFTRDGKLDEGMAVQQEIEKIKRRYLASAGDGSTGGSKRKAVDIVTQCEQAIRDRIATSQAQYVKELDALTKSYQAKGELESLFAVKNEHERFMNAGRIEDANIVQAPAELRQLQQQYKSLPEKLGQETALGYVKALEEQKKNLTVEGKLDEAMAVKKDIEKIQQRYSVEGEQPSVSKTIVGKWTVFTEKGIQDAAACRAEFTQDGRFILREPDQVDWSGTYQFINPERTKILRTCNNGATFTLTYDKQSDTWVQNGGWTYRRCGGYRKR